MKRLTGVLALALLASAFSWRPLASDRDDEAQIRQLYDDWAKAFRAHDIDGIMAMYAPDVVAFDFVPPLRYAGREAYRKDYEEFVAAFEGPIDVEFRDLKIVAGKEVAFVYALERISASTKGGEKIDFWGRCTTGFRKIDGKWRDIHDHCSVPVDLETGKAALDLTP